MFDVVIGLEIHAQLSSKSKCFSGASTQFSEGPNQSITPLCAGLPGTLPVLNKKAVELAIKSSLALNCEVQKRSVFSRKQYFYPDMPKGYQITQYEEPIALGGYVDFFVDGEKNRVLLERAHMEEDAGKSSHFGEFSLVNLNRAGIPLLEIVSKPAMTSAKQAAAYARAVRQILIYAEVCDGNLEEGSLRCDCNVSIKPQGQRELGTKVELKNLNSFRFIEKALDYEIQRQIQCAKRGEEIIQETRLYDSTKNKTFSMRKKEEANDYRYFPEPDLLPLELSDEQIEEIRSVLPETPIQRFERFAQEYGLKSQDIDLLLSEKALADYFEDVVAQVQDAQLVSNWMGSEYLRLIKEENRRIEDHPIGVENFSTLLQMVKTKEISGKMGKEVLEILWKTGQDPKAIVEERGMKQISDPQAIRDLVQKVINENPKQVEDFRGGKNKIFGFFVGQIMKLSKGQANPDEVNRILKELLK